MKYTKYQQDLLKVLMSDKPIRGFIGHDGDLTFVTVDGYLLAAIPDYMWYLDTNKVVGKLGAFTKDITSIYDEKASKPGYLTGHTYVSEKKTLVQIKNDNTEVWVNENLLRYFENSVFMIRSPKHAVGVYEGDLLVGVVMPTFKKELFEES